MANKHVVFWSVALSVLVLDRVSKLLVLAYLPLSSSYALGPIALTHVRNTGTLFGLGKSAGVLLGLFAAIVTLYIAFNYKKHPIQLQPVLGLIFAGALGNLIDRLVHGSVIDFIDVRIWPVFNVADSAVTIAIGFLLYDSFFGKHKL